MWHRTPLIANLTVLENVALMAEYHRHLPARRAEPEARALLERLELGWAADLRPGRLGPEQAFGAQLARAAARQGARLVLVEPFVMLAGAADAAPVRAALEALGRLAPVTVLDYVANGERYAAEERCP